MPKAFISYSWTSPAHEAWVIDLASQLRENGVDVILDKWDLREGNDAVKFMESMVTDSTVSKVIIVADRTYAEKSDERKGGVGTESQIISAEIYNKSDQNKFVVVVAELDSDGRPFLPVYFRSRIYVDLSNEEIFPSNFDQLLRWIFDRPMFVKPSLGKIPEFLKDSSIEIPTRSRARRCIDLLQKNQPQAVHAVEDYFETFSESLELHRLKREEPFDEKVVASIEAFLPARNEFIDVLSAATKYIPSELPGLLRTFFEKSMPLLTKPENVNSWNSTDFDNLAFIVHELFLYSIAILLDRDRFVEVSSLLNEAFYVQEEVSYGRNPMRYFDVIQRQTDSLVNRTARLGLNRISLRADLLEQRSHLSSVSFKSLKQADLVLFIRAAVNSAAGVGDQWFPQTLLYTYSDHGAYKVFARAQSSSYFDKLKRVLGVADKGSLLQLVENMGSVNKPLWLPQWQFHTLPIKAITNLDLIASRN